MTPKEELKILVTNMNDKQFERFVAQMRIVLSEEVNGGRKVVAT